MQRIPTLFDKLQDRAVLEFVAPVFTRDSALQKDSGTVETSLPGRTLQQLVSTSVDIIT